MAEKSSNGTNQLVGILKLVLGFALTVIFTLAITFATFRYDTLDENIKRLDATKAEKDVIDERLESIEFKLDILLNGWGLKAQTDNSHGG